MRSLVWLRERFSNVIPWLAFPYGLTSVPVADAARSAGYDGALRVDGGWLPPPSRAQIDPYDMPRHNIPAGLSLRGFELRTSGLLDR
jgi:hypothetical protein